MDSGGLQGKVSPHFPVAPCLENSASVPCLECKYITTLCMLVPFLFSIALVPQTSRLRHCLIVPYLPVMLQDKRKTIQTTEALFTRDLPSAITNKIPTSCLFFKTGISWLFDDDENDTLIQRCDWSSACKTHLYDLWGPRKAIFLI